MGKGMEFEQLVLPPTDMIQLGSSTETDKSDAELDYLKNALSFAWHVIEVLAADGQLEEHVDENGYFIPYDFMEESLQPLVANFPPLTCRDVWQLALELHSAYESMPLEMDEIPLSLEAVAA